MGTAELHDQDVQGGGSFPDPRFPEMPEHGTLLRGLWADSSLPPAPAEEEEERRRQAAAVAAAVAAVHVGPPIMVVGEDGLLYELAAGEGGEVVDGEDDEGNAEGGAAPMAE